MNEHRKIVTVRLTYVQHRSLIADSREIGQSMNRVCLNRLFSHSSQRSELEKFALSVIAMRDAQAKCVIDSSKENFETLRKIESYVDHAARRASNVTETTAGR